MAKEININDNDGKKLDDSILDKDLYKKEDIEAQLSQYSWFVNPLEETPEDDE